MVYRIPGKEMDKSLVIKLTVKEMVELLYEARPEIFEGFFPENLIKVKIVETDKQIHNTPEKHLYSIDPIDDSRTINVHLSARDIMLFPPPKSKEWV